MKIHKDQMFPPVLKAIPSFRPIWDEFLREWESNPEDLPIYLALADLARHVVAMLQNNEPLKLKAVFEIVERWLLEGDPWVKEATVVGFLENLQNTNIHETTQPEDLAPYLSPETTFWWEKVYEFWESGKMISDTRPGTDGSG